MKLGIGEERLVGSWVFDGNTMTLDATALRIQQLTDGTLLKVATDDSGWSTLYKDKEDGRFWEMTYPQGQMQGGGPPSLIHLSEAEVKAKYQFIHEA